MAKASVKTADFSNVKERGNFNPARVAAGDYVAKIVKVEDGESKKTGEFQYVFTIKLAKYSQYSYPYYAQLKENQLWKLRNLLIASGLNVPKARMKLDPNKVVGRTIGVTMEDDEYEDKEKSVVGAVFPASELSESSEADVEEDEDEEEDSIEDIEDEVDEEPKKKKKKKAEPEEEDEAPAKKKKKKKKSDDVEELDLDDLD